MALPVDATRKLGRLNHDLKVGFDNLSAMTGVQHAVYNPLLLSL
jgi:hypothetical protein